MKVSETNVNFGRQAYAKEVGNAPPPEVEQPKTADVKPDRPGDKVSLSTDARAIQVAKEAVAAAPEVREDVVNVLKQEVDNGTYELNAQRIADKIVGGKIDEVV